LVQFFRRLDPHDLCPALAQLATERRRVDPGWRLPEDAVGSCRAAHQAGAGIERKFSHLAWMRLIRAGPHVYLAKRQERPAGQLEILRSRFFVPPRELVE